MVLESSDENHISLIDLLVEKGADINAQDKYGDTALHMISTQTSKAISLLNHILNKGADPSIPNNRGAYPIDYTVDKKVKAVLKKFKKRN